MTKPSYSLIRRSMAALVLLNLSSSFLRFSSDSMALLLDWLTAILIFSIAPKDD